MPYKDYEEHKRKARENYSKNREKRKRRVREQQKDYINPNRTPEDYFSVYYISEKHYCGYTNNLRERSRHHGVSVDDMRILFCSEDEVEAVIKEAEYHLLGMNGNKEITRIKNKKEKL